jgi:ribosomal protein S25
VVSGENISLTLRSKKKKWSKGKVKDKANNAVVVDKNV